MCVCISFNHANGQKYHTFLRFRTLKNNLTVDFTRKNHPGSINIAVAIARLSKTKRMVELFEFVQAFLIHMIYQNFV